MTVKVLPIFTLRTIANYHRNPTFPTRHPKIFADSMAHWATRRLAMLEKEIEPVAKRSNRTVTSAWQMINVPLTTSELKKFDEWARENLGDIEELCRHVMSAGYKIGISYHDDSGSFIATLTGKDVDHCENKRMSMSSWSREMDDAIMMAVYKHVVVFSEGAWQEREQQARRG